jgi:hypothetical protein
VKHKLAQLGALFVWHLAKLMVREAAWMTVDAARQRIRRRRRLAAERSRVIDLRYQGGVWKPDRLSYDGPAGYRMAVDPEENDEP